MELQTTITEYIAKAASSQILTDIVSHFNTTAPDVTTVAAGVTTTIGIIMTRKNAVHIATYAGALVISLGAYFFTDVVLSRILQVVKFVLCTIAALLMFLTSKTLIQEYVV